MWDIFIAKYSAQGGLLWVKDLGGSGDDIARGVAIDSADNIIVVGDFSTSVNFGGGSLTSSGYTDVFVAKYSSSGAYVWAARFGGSFYDLGNAVAVDSANAIYLAARTQSTSDFGGIALPSLGGIDIAVAKLSSTGAVAWAKRWGGTGNDIPQGIAVDRAGDVVLTGTYGGASDLGGGSITGVAAYNVFLAKYSGADGSYRWSRPMGNANASYSYGVATDPNTGNIVITGGCLGTMDFGGGSVGDAGSGIFLAAYGSGGNSLWTKVFGDHSSTTAANGTSVDIDSSGNIGVTGQILSAVTFGGSWLYGNGNPNYVVASFTSAGAYRWAKRAAGNGVSYGNGIAFDAFGHSVAVGSFTGTADMGGSSVTRSTAVSSSFAAQYVR